MVRKIEIHKLELEKIIPYFIDHISCDKTLSQRVCDKIDFNQGSFFTVLPSNALLDKMFNFNDGGIIPTIPYGNKTYIIKGQSERFHPQQIITVDRECSEFIANFLSQSHENWLVIENYMLNPQSLFANVENLKMAPYDSDVYFFLNKENSLDEICKALRKSNAVWHFLAVLTQLKGDIPIPLTDLTIDQICKNAKFVITGAYDCESYIFWEAKNGAERDFMNNKFIWGDPIVLTKNAPPNFHLGENGSILGSYKITSEEGAKAFQCDIGDRIYIIGFPTGGIAQVAEIYLEKYENEK